MRVRLVRRSRLEFGVKPQQEFSAQMFAVFRSVRGYVRVFLDSRATPRQFDRLGLTSEILEARAAEIDAATPDFAQTRGKPWAEIGDASAAYLTLLRQLPDRAGADAIIDHFRRAGARTVASRSPHA